MDFLRFARPGGLGVLRAAPGLPDRLRCKLWGTLCSSSSARRTRLRFECGVFSLSAGLSLLIFICDTDNWWGCLCSSSSARQTTPSWKVAGAAPFPRLEARHLRAHWPPLFNVEAGIMSQTGITLSLRLQHRRTLSLRLRKSWHLDPRRRSQCRQYWKSVKTDAFKITRFDLLSHWCCA